MDDGTFQFLHLDSQSHTSATGEAIRDRSIQLVSRLSVSNILVLILGCAFL